MQSWPQGQSEHNLKASMSHPCPNLKVLSIHIPKTGGTSFRNTLKGIYGESSVVRVDALNKTDPIQVNNEAIPPDASIDVPVIHGHLTWKVWESRFQKPDAPPKIITWVRDPVERVTSQYHYLVSVLKKELDEPGKGLDILSKLMKTFPEFIRNPKMQNLMSRYFTIADLEAHMDFVGVLAHREEDLNRLGQILNWPQFEDHQHNRTQNRPTPTPEEIDLIRAFNQSDVRLYEQVLEWREQGKYLP